MQHKTVTSETTIAWGAAWRALPGQTVCGDLHLVKPGSDGILLGVVDGLGHGDEAIAAAKSAVATLEAHASEPLSAIVKRCHEALTKTRGAVMTVATLQPSASHLTWLGVGNVEAVLLRAGSNVKAPPVHVLLRSGIVGYQLPELSASNLSVSPGDLLVFATDGIGAGFTKGIARSDSPQQIAE